MRLIGILGGTFNPIHFGHLRMAQELAEVLQFDEVLFIPAANPPHKAIPSVSASHRAKMVNIAIADNPLFKSDERELKRNGASYTFDTLVSLKDELDKNTALCLILGSDAFINLNTWHRWQELLHYCHLVLVQRPSVLNSEPKLAANLELLLRDHYTENIADLTVKSSGFIHMQKITALDISSTAIREMFKHGLTPRYLMSDQQINYINQHQLYK